MKLDLASVQKIEAPETRFGDLLSKLQSNNSPNSYWNGALRAKQGGASGAKEEQVVLRKCFGSSNARLVLEGEEVRLLE